MEILEAKLREILKQIDDGAISAPITVRKILEWAEVSRRGANVSAKILSIFDKVGLATSKDFEWAYPDEPISIVKQGSEEKGSSSISYRIGSLESAHNKPVRVKPDSELAEAVTIMLKNNYSQLPVMTSDREIKGVISWKTIGAGKSAERQSKKVRDYMETAQIISSELSLFDAIDIIIKYEYAIIQANDKIICGIVTASDLSQQLKTLAGPFMLIGECERMLRKMIYGIFSTQQLSNVKNQADDSRVINGVSDLTLGEYTRLIENPDNWSKLRLPHIERGVFIKDLNTVREIRNNIMHFNPEGIDQKEFADLEAFYHLLVTLRTIAAHE